MKRLWLLMALVGAVAAPSQAQDAIYRCGNEYTNTKPDARANKNCKRVEAGNVTVVQGTPVPKSSAPKPNAASVSKLPRVDAVQQKARDSDMRRILQEELNAAQARLEDLKREYKDGEPDKLGPETRNYQKYLDRVAELKASLARTESDIAGIRREMDRLPAAAGPQ